MPKTFLIKIKVFYTLLALCIVSCGEKDVSLEDSQRRLIESGKDNIKYKTTLSDDTINLSVIEKDIHCCEAYKSKYKQYEYGELSYNSIDSTNHKISVLVEAREDPDESILRIGCFGMGYSTDWGENFVSANGVSVDGESFSGVRVYEKGDDPLKVWILPSEGIIKAEDKESGEVYERIF